MINSKEIPPESVHFRNTLMLAIAMALAAEFVLWVVYGLILFPGNAGLTFLWASCCGLAMGATLGAITCLFIGNKQGKKAFFATFLIAALVLSLCNIVCFTLDQKYNFWGAVEQPALFLGGGFFGVLVGGIAYGWFVTMPTGRRILARFAGTMK